MTFEEFVGEDVQGNEILDQTYLLDTNRICPQKLSLAGKELSMPDPWLRVLEWKVYANNLAKIHHSSCTSRFYE